MPAFNRYRYLILFLFAFICHGVYAQGISKTHTYDQTIQIICNLSDINSQRVEKRSIGQLLKENIGGFRFHLMWDHESSQLLYKRSDGQLRDFGPVVDQISQYLDQNPDRILTLFLDLNLPIDTLKKAFKQKGLVKFFYKKPKDKGWPPVEEMLQQQKRIVLFTMESIFNQPDWLHHVWDYAVEPYFALFEAPNFLGEFLKGDPKSDLLIINDFNIPSNSIDRHPIYIIDQNTNHYLLSHCLAIWRSTGKVPNFIFLDKYTDRMQAIVNNLRSFNTVQGRLTYNRETLDYVNWEGRENCQTGGKYVFPIVPGDKITLRPSVPGYRFTPESVFLDEPGSSVVQNFIASPRDISDGLVAYYPFDKRARDAGLNKNDGKPARVDFVTDKQRGNVARFNGNGYIVLPKAEKLMLRNHDFTICAWVKLSPNDNNDNSILGTTVRSYQEGIHFTIREKRPYLGFYSNDLQGNEVIDDGIWYYITARYNKLNGEQAIFVNGKLDNKSLGHPPYQGKEDIIIGNASFGWKAFFNGELDDVAIWSRPLGDQEIFNLAMDVLPIVPQKKPLFSMYSSGWVVAVMIIFLVAMLIWYMYRKNRKHTHEAEEGAAQYAHYGHAKQVSLHDKNLVKLFGVFKVLNAQGVDISREFTPKIKTLFLAILLHSTRSRNGITTEELTELVWPEQDAKSAKNSRGVTIRKLRVILEQLDKVEVIFARDRWTVRFAESAYCDFYECMYLLDNPTFSDLDYYFKLYNIVQDGQIVKNENYPWMDDIKGYVDYRVIDIMLKYIGLLDSKNEADLILKIIDRIHVSDPVNEKAFEIKVKILISQDNYNFAKYCYDTFCKNFNEFYGQQYQKSFEELVSLVGQ